MKRALAVTVILVVTVILIIAFLVWPNRVRALIDHDKVFELTYQFLLIGVIGGALTLFYQSVQRQRDVREAERGLQRQLLIEVVQAYNGAKKVRRLVRAKARANDLIRGEPYDEQMESLLDIQLNFESLKHQAEANPQLFPINSGVRNALESIETYLNRIMDEYEKKLSLFAGAPATLPLAQLGELKEFIADHRAGTDFDKFLKGAFHNLVAALQKLIIA
jgi:hypothetical protein